MMEGPIEKEEKKVEDFDSFKKRIETAFKEKQPSEELKLEIKEWRSKKAAELDKSRNNANEHEVAFLLESAQLFEAIEQFDDSWDCLDGAWQLASLRGDTELRDTVEHWMDVIHGKK